MTAAAPELGDIDTAFTAALQTDAGTAAGTGSAPPPPPRKSDNPDAPHGYADDGVTPLAPYGHKPDGRPRIKPGGPGRRRPGEPDDRARVSPVRPASSPGSASPGPESSDGPDYTAELADLGTTVWLAGSMLRGGRIWILPLPDTRPYAAVWKQQLPQLVGAANAACKQSATCRGYLERVSGDGAWSWKIGVAVAGVSLVAAIAEMAKADAAVKAIAAELNDTELDRFMSAQLAELGLVPAELADAGQAAAA